MNYTTSSTGSAMGQQPLPGQPPLPTAPPPSATAPPPPNVFAPVSSQMHQMHAWPAAPAWQWIAQPPALPPPTPRDIQPTTQYRDMQHRNNFVKRERHNNVRNNIYSQRDNYSKKYRRRYEQNQNHYDQNSYYGAAMANNYGVDWPRGGYGTQGNDQWNQMQPETESGAFVKDVHHKDVKEEVVVKKNKQRKPMSLSYPSRPWNKEDAERALKTENDYNKIIKAHSLIIKFPDPDLNKEIVRKFNPGIQNIHFQNPSGPRYCFVQMSDKVDIDKAIEEMEKIPFGMGFLKVERKFFRSEDNPVPQEIDPYTLYIGNLPESVNVNEVKGKFPSAVRVDVGFAQKMRNTRYAFIRYNSVDESIEAYKHAHDLMWDTRSIIVRFRRQRGNTCLPGESKANQAKQRNLKAKEANIQADDISGANKATSQEKSPVEDSKEVINVLTPTSKGEKKPLKKRIITNNGLLKEEIEVDEALSPKMVCIKEEPGDYFDEMDDLPVEEDDEDDDEDQIMKSHIDSDDSELDDADNVNEVDEDDDNDGSESSTNFSRNSRESRLKDDFPSDHLDKMFNDIDNIASDITL